jgi:putative tricarboxylic transport membrane protein
MDTLGFLYQGFVNALSIGNMLFALIGAVLGTIVGVLPGLGPAACIAMLLPLTNVLPPIPAIIMLAAIYYGAMYGGSTTSILLNIPGEAASVTSCLDGYVMAKQGRAAAALAISAIGSFIAGSLGLVGLTFFSLPLANMALSMGPPEMFALVLFAFSMVVSLSGKSLIRGISSAALGMLISMVGLDPALGIERFTFGSTLLLGGLNLVPIVMGLFGLKEIFENAGTGIAPILKVQLGPWWKMIRWRELRQSIGAIFRSTILGFFLGCLPGCSPAMVTFMSYDLEKKVSKNRANFGKGAIEGVAAPEAANNATTSGNFVPLLTLGIAPSPSLAVLLSGLMIYGLQPGPLLFEKQPDFVWTVIASMYIGNVMLLILNLPLVKIWARIAIVPYYYIVSIVLLFCFVGAYSIRNSFFDVAISLVFGFIGLLLDKLKMPSVPLVLALILTPMLENSLLQTISMGGNSIAILWSRPIAMGLIAASILITFISLYLRSSGSMAQVCLEAEDV